MSDLEATAREALSSKPIPYRWHNEPGVMLVHEKQVYKLMTDKAELARGVLSLLEEREQLERDLRSHHLMLVSLKEVLMKEGQVNLAVVIQNYLHSGEALAPREEVIP